LPTATVELRALERETAANRTVLEAFLALTPKFPRAAMRPSGA
jgi:hypothetical protein